MTIEYTSALALLPTLGWMEWGIILAVFILFFGAKKLPELAKGVGKSIKEFKKATSNIEEDIRTAMDEDPKPANKIDTPENKETASK